MRSEQITIDLIALFQSCGCGVPWNPSALVNAESRPSISGLVKGLVSQILEKHRGLVDRCLEDLDIAKFQEHHTDTEWIDSLTRLVAKFENYFIFVETEDLFQANREDPQWSSRFLGIFQKIVNSSAACGNVLKILLVGYNASLTTLTNLPGSDRRIVASLSPPIPVPNRRRRGLYTRKTGGGEWQALRSRIWRRKV